jgi:hypothetical protein
VNIEDVELKLLSAEPIEIEECGKVHIPTVREVVRMGESKYSQLLSILLLDKKNIEGESGVTYDPFDILFANCFHNEEFKQDFLDAIEMAFRKKATMCDVITSSKAFFYFDNGGRIHGDNFAQIQEIIRIGNHARVSNDEDTYNPANEVTARIIAEMLERKKRKKKPRPTINLHSMISGLAWKSGVPHISDILNLTMYQFYDGYKRIENLDSIHYTLYGIYTGNVDAKKINIKDLSFAKILDAK